VILYTNIPIQAIIGTIRKIVNEGLRYIMKRQITKSSDSRLLLGAKYFLISEALDTNMTRSPSLV